MEWTQSSSRRISESLKIGVIQQSAASSRHVRSVWGPQRRLLPRSDVMGAGARCVLWRVRSDQLWGGGIWSESHERHQGQFTDATSTPLKLCWRHSLQTHTHTQLILLLCVVCIRTGGGIVLVDSQEDAYDGRIGKEVCPGWEDVLWWPVAVWCEQLVGESPVPRAEICPEYFPYFSSTNLSVISVPQVLCTTRTEFCRLWTTWLWPCTCCASGPTLPPSGFPTFARFLKSTTRLCSTSSRTCSCCTARRRSRMFWASTEIPLGSMLISTNWYRWVLSCQVLGSDAVFMHLWWGKSFKYR